MRRSHTREHFPSNTKPSKAKTSKPFKGGHGVPKPSRDCYNDGGKSPDTAILRDAVGHSTRKSL